MILILSSTLACLQCWSVLCGLFYVSCVVSYLSYLSGVVCPICLVWSALFVCPMWFALCGLSYVVSHVVLSYMVCPIWSVLSVLCGLSYVVCPVRYV